MPEIPLVRHDWMDDAACITIPGFTELPIIEQVLTCGACPVKEPCKAYGIKQDEPRLSVVYGGLTGRQLAAAAKAAGIEPRREPVRTGGIYDLACIVCGRGFTANRPQARYCTQACQAVAYRFRKASA